VTPEQIDAATDRLIDQCIRCLEDETRNMTLAEEVAVLQGVMAGLGGWVGATEHRLSQMRQDA
jgi:hypothetical protein